MEYQTGQAVINEYDRLVFIDYITKTTYRCISFHYIALNITTSYGKKRVKRPATEAEILAEAEKNGWDTDNGYIESKYVTVIKDSNGEWEWNYPTYVPTSEAGIFGNECIKAHTLITALNLVK